jgi:hypothetical protein
MGTQFECLGCGHVSPLERLPAKCPKCGNGNGILQEISDSMTAPLGRSPGGDRSSSDDSGAMG